MYRCADAVLVRAAVHPVWADVPAWPDLTGMSGEHVAQWRDWLEQVWARESFADAITVATPDLARRVAAVRDGHVRDPRQARRVVMAVARYVLRMTGRATPFGLFSGVAAAGLGSGLIVRWGEGHRLALRPDAGWLAAVVTNLEACPELLDRLPVVANNVCFVRDGRLVAPDQQHPGGCGDDVSKAAPVEVSVRYTRVVAAAVRYARSPIVAGDLAGKLAADFPRASGAVIGGMLAEMVRLRLLLTSLRPPMTNTDPLGHVTDQLTAAEAVTIAQVAGRVRLLREIWDDVARHNRARSPHDRRDLRARVAERRRGAGDVTGRPFAVDLLLDARITLPLVVAREAEAAAAALTRLTPYPSGLPALVGYHAAFLERYGIGAVIPVLEVINPGTGLGFPATYRGSARKVPEPPLSGRDELLFALAQRTALAGGIEMELDDQMISAMAAGNAGVRVPPHAEIFAEIHAPDPAAVERGEFRLVVAGASRAAGTTTGRFLDLLSPADRDRFERVYAGLPVLRADAVPAQVSCPPVFARSEGVARAPSVLPRVIGVAEHPGPGGNVLPLDDLAVCGDADGLWLVSLSGQRPVEPTVLNAVEFRNFSHPVTRFLCEITRARMAVYMPFSWGATVKLPFLPRVRHGRSVLTPARWNLPSSDLPGLSASWSAWAGAVASWRERYRLPEQVFLAEADHLFCAWTSISRCTFSSCEHTWASAITP